MLMVYHKVLIIIHNYTPIWCGNTTFLRYLGYNIFLTDSPLCRTTFVANQHTHYIPLDIHMQHGSLHLVKFRNKWYHLFLVKLKCIKQFQANLVIKSVRMLFPRGTCMKSTSPLPFGLRLNTPSTTSILGNNFRQVCWHRLFCYRAIAYFA